MSAAEPIVTTPAPESTPPSSGLKFAPTPGAPAGDPPAPEPIKLAPWMGELDADHAAYVKGKGWLADGKTFADVVKAHRSAEGFIGRPADQVIVKPDWSKPESVAEYRASKGAPADPTGYETPQTKLPVGLVDGQRVAQISHVLALSQDEHVAFVGEVAKFFEEAYSGREKEISMRRGADNAELKKELGGNYEAFRQNVQNAITSLGITEEDYDIALTLLDGDEKRVQRFLDKLAAGMKEATPGDQGAGGFGTMSVEGAQADIRAMQGDASFMKDLEGPDGPRKQAALQRWQHAMAIIAPKD